MKSVLYTLIGACFVFGTIDTVSAMQVSGGQNGVRVAQSTDIFEVVSGGDLNEVKKFVTNNPGSLKVKDDKGSTPLHFASYGGYLDIVEYLVEECGCDVNAEDNSKKTPADVAKKDNVRSYLNAISQCANAFDAVSSKNLSAVKYFAARGEVNAEDDGLTLLHIAAQRGYFDIVKYLVEECHFDVDAKANDNKTPIDVAKTEEIKNYLTSKKIKTNNIPTLQQRLNYLRGKNTETADEDKKSEPTNVTPKGGIHTDKAKNDRLNAVCLINAVGEGNLDAVRKLIEEKHIDVERTDFSRFNMGPLCLASEKGYFEIVKYLVKECHANVEAKSNNGMTPLLIASQKGHFDIVKYLVKDCHCNVETKDTYDNTPLHWASQGGHFEIVKYLVEGYHCDVDAKNNQRWTPLHRASQGGHFDIVKYLIEEGHANAEIANQSGGTSVDVAKTPQIRRFLKNANIIHEINSLLKGNENITEASADIKEAYQLIKLDDRNISAQVETYSWNDKNSWPSIGDSTDTEAHTKAYIETMKACAGKAEELGIKFDDVLSLKIDGDTFVPYPMLISLTEVAIARTNCLKKAQLSGNDPANVIVYLADIGKHLPGLNSILGKDDLIEYTITVVECLKQAKKLGIDPSKILQLINSPTFAMFSIAHLQGQKCDKQVRAMINRAIKDSDLFFKYASVLLENTPMKNDPLMQRTLRVLAMIGHKEAIKLLGGNPEDMEIINSLEDLKETNINDIIKENDQIDEEYKQYILSATEFPDRKYTVINPKVDNGRISWNESQSSIKASLPIRKSFVGDIVDSYPWPIQKFDEKRGVSGWKIHISAYPSTAKKVMEIVFPILDRQKCRYKLSNDIKRLRYLMLDSIYDSGLSQAGKFIVIYTDNDKQAREVVNEIEKGFKDAHLHGIKDFPPCIGEFQIGDTGGIFVRWSLDYTGQKEGRGMDIRRLPKIAGNRFSNEEIPEKHPFDQELTYLGMKIDKNHFREYVLPEEIEEAYEKLNLSETMRR